MHAWLGLGSVVSSQWEGLGLGLGFGLRIGLVLGWGVVRALVKDEVHAVCGEAQHDGSHPVGIKVETSVLGRCRSGAYGRSGARRRAITLERCAVGHVSEAADQGQVLPFGRFVNS